MRKAIKICNFFHTNLDYIFGLSNNKNLFYNKVFDYVVSGKRINKFRKYHNFSLRELSLELGTASSTIHSYEKGKTLVLTAFTYQIVIKYGVSIDWIVGNSDQMFINNNVKMR